MYRRDSERAKAWRDQAGTSPFLDETTKLRVQIAIALAEGDHVAAKHHTDTLHQALNRSNDRGTAIAYRDWISQVLQQHDTQTSELSQEIY